MSRTINLSDKIINDLFRDIPEDVRCPHIKRDQIGPYCSKGLKKNYVVGTRRLVCDVASLQLFCLNQYTFSRCIYHQSESLD